MTARTLNYEIKTVRSIINWGIKQGLCRNNPAKTIPLLKNNDSKKPRFLTAEECRLFLRACDELQYPIFFTFLNTGLRLGELINLQWSDVDLQRRRLKTASAFFKMSRSSVTSTRSRRRRRNSSSSLET